MWGWILSSLLCVLPIRNHQLESISRYLNTIQNIAKTNSSIVFTVPRPINVLSFILAAVLIASVVAKDKQTQRLGNTEPTLWEK